MKYNKRGGWNKRGGFLFILIPLTGVIYGKRKKCWSKVKAIFQVLSILFIYIILRSQQ